MQIWLIAVRVLCPLKTVRNFYAESRKDSNICKRFFTNILCVVYVTFRNFIVEPLIIGKAWNYKTVTISIYFAEITKVLKYSITHYVNKPQNIQ